MTRRLLVLPVVAAVAALLGASTPTSAADGDATCASAVEQSQTIVDSTGVPLPDGWSINFHCNPDQIAAYTEPGGRTIHLFGEWSSPDNLQWAAVHETGHAHDLEHLTDAERQTWRQMRGLPADTAWWSHGEMAVDEWAASPAEDLGEAFAACHLGVPDREWVTPGGPPDVGQCVILRSMLG